MIYYYSEMLNDQKNQELIKHLMSHAVFTKMDAQFNFYLIHCWNNVFMKINLNNIAISGRSGVVGRINNISK